MARGLLDKFILFRCTFLSGLYNVNNFFPVIFTRFASFHQRKNGYQKASNLLQKANAADFVLVESRCIWLDIYTFWELLLNASFPQFEKSNSINYINNMKNQSETITCLQDFHFKKSFKTSSFIIQPVARPESSLKLCTYQLDSIKTRIQEKNSLINLFDMFRVLCQVKCCQQ